MGDAVSRGRIEDVEEKQEGILCLKFIWARWKEQFIIHRLILDNRYEDEWITKPLSVEMIKDIDKSVVVGSHLIQSPVLGPISTKELSGGVKTLMLMAFDSTGKIFNASVCGDNCAKWILKISREKDLTINLRHIMEFPEEEFQAEIWNKWGNSTGHEFVCGYCGRICIGDGDMKGKYRGLLVQNNRGTAL